MRVWEKYFKNVHMLRLETISGHPFSENKQAYKDVHCNIFMI